MVWPTLKKADPFTSTITAMKIKFTSLFLLCALISQAQQKPMYTQYILNNYIINPALSGIENYTDVKLSNRNQWTGIDGAPVTTYLSLHGPIGKSDYRTTSTSYDVPGENPRGRSFVSEYTAPAPHHGYGLIVMNDKAGYINRFTASLSYAYHKPVSVRSTLAVGFQAGITSVKLDRSKIDWATLDPNDPAIGYDNGELKKLKPELGVGLWLYSAEYFAGASVLNIVPGKAKFGSKDSSTYGSTFKPQMLGTAGYRFFLSDDLTLLPSGMVQFISPYPVQFHANAKLQYQDKAWIGASYRFGDDFGGYAGMAGFHIGNFLSVGYSYDVASGSRLRTYSKNTHEFVIGFILGNKYGDSCPRAAW